MIGCMVSSHHYDEDEGMVSDVVFLPGLVMIIMAEVAILVTGILLVA